MSSFSGKCDFCDCFVMIHSDGDEKKAEENLKNLDLCIYTVDGRRHKIETNTIKDIVKYYPYLESMGAYSNGKYCVVLSSRPFIDIEEEEHRSWRTNEVLKYWKKHKKDFDEQACYDDISKWDKRDENLKEMIHLVAQYGNKADFSDIHYPMQEHYRREWFEEMVRVGYTELEAYNWCFNDSLDHETIKKRLGREIHIKKLED